MAACAQGRKVRFFRVTEMITLLLEAKEERQLLRLRQQLGKLDLLILDELGYVPASKAGAELLFDVIATAYERNSLIVTTNLPFENWTEVLGSERLTGAGLGPADPSLPHPGDQGRELPPPGRQTPPQTDRLISSVVHLVFHSQHITPTQRSSSPNQRHHFRPPAAAILNRPQHVLAADRHAVRFAVGLYGRQCHAPIALGVGLGGGCCVI